MKKKKKCPKHIWTFLSSLRSPKFPKGKSSWKCDNCKVKQEGKSEITDPRGEKGKFL